MARRHRRSKAHRNVGAGQWFATYQGGKVLGPTNLDSVVSYIAKNQMRLGANKFVHVCYRATPMDQCSAWQPWNTIPMVNDAVEQAYALSGRNVSKMKAPFMPFSTGIIHLLPTPKGQPSDKTPQERMWESIDRLEKRLKKARLSQKGVHAVNDALDLLDDMVLETNGNLSHKQLSNMAYKWGHAYEEMECEGVSSKHLASMQRIARAAFKMAIDGGATSTALARRP